ncbi:MAG: Stp1/IreP family PP2C-type Ser/Thr phosphatase [Ruminococcaceae bacterium]|nr:Stp1/IreP family PP2C-type Ser/Thr phosphatase [Oscillospiraceae bacterium]
MNLCGLTDVGLQRANNQDTFRQMELEEARGLFVVCDGMGGAQAGNIASEIAASVFLEHLKRYIRPTMSSRYAESILVNAINFANYEVYKKSMSDASYSGMGTTLVGGFIQHGEIMLANIGDSRAYRCVRNPENGWKLERITRDHSVVEEMLLRGDLTEEQARRHPRRNLITRALGTEEHVKADMYPVKLEENEMLLLCSDGLTSMLDDAEIADILQQNEDMQTSASALIAAANERGGSDNITVMLVNA